MTLWALIPLITCLTYISLLILTLPSIKRRIHRIFAFYIGIAAIWSFTSFMLHFNLLPQQALLWNELLTAALIATLVAYYHFIRAYINKSPGYGVYIGYALTIVLLVLCLSGYIVQYAYVIDGVLYHSLGISIYFIGAVALAYSGTGLYLLIKKYRSSVDPKERNKTIYLITGWSILNLLGYSNLIPVVAGFPLDHIGSLINVLIISYAISKFQLIDIRSIMRKGLVYSSLTVLLTALYLVLLSILQTVFHGWTGYSSIPLAAGFAIMIALLFNPLRNFLQRGIDRIFSRETYDYRQMLLSFSNRISNVLDLGELAQSILAPIVDILHAKRAALLFPRSESGDFTTQFTRQATTEEPPTRLRLTNDNPIVTWLATEGQAFRQELIDTNPQFKGLWETERVELKTPDVELFCPIRSKGNLIGILAVGKKRSDSPYYDEEVDLLMTIANEAAVAIENARMLDSLKNEQLRVEQLLTQAVYTQEEERKRISVDLHDSVAQWLAAASYRAQAANALLTGNDNHEAQEELTAVESTIDKSLKELRRVVTGLRPPALDELGLRHALRQSLEDLKTDGVDCQFSEKGTPVRLPPNTEIAVYRLAQEALTNIRKHADATKVNLRLQFRTDEIVVEVRDNGKGFDLARTLDSAISVGHMGLLGMKQRVETGGGDIKIKTREGSGTTITLRFPIQS
ncbi:histidine kinase [Chloroflexota bacterium]